MTDVPATDWSIKVEMNAEREGFSPISSASEILHTATTGSLATLDARGAPFASLVAVAIHPGGEPVLLVSALALHTQNLERDSRASLLLVAPGGEGGNPLAGARLTLSGQIVAEEARDAAKARFLNAHPEAADYADFRDFGFRRLVPEQMHLVAGFGRIVTLAASEVIEDFADAAEVVAAEAGILEHMNADHGAALNLFATRLLDRAPGPWRAIGSDPDGLDLAADGLRARLRYPERARTLGAVRQTLKELAETARKA